MACGSCPRCENVENRKAGFPHLSQARWKTRTAKNAVSSFPQLPQGPTTGFSFYSFREEPESQTHGLETKVLIVVRKRNG